MGSLNGQISIYHTLFYNFIQCNFLQYTLYPTKSGFKAQVWELNYTDASSYVIVKYGSALCLRSPILYHFCRQLVKQNIFLLKYKIKKWLNLVPTYIIYIIPIMITNIFDTLIIQEAVYYRYIQ